MYTVHHKSSVPIKNKNYQKCFQSELLGKEKKKKKPEGDEFFLQNFLAFCSEEMDWHLAQITIKQPIILWCIISVVHIQEEDSLTSNHVVTLIPSPTNTSEGRTLYPF